MTNPVDTNGNVKVDFVWGNMPLQPNDQRGMAQLDPALDNHSTATGAWQGFPGFTPNTGFAPSDLYSVTDWFSFSHSIILSTVLFADADADLVANPTNYVVVVSGSATLDGTYPITLAQTANNAGYSGDNHLAVTTATTFGYHTSGDEGGTVTVTLA